MAEDPRKTERPSNVNEALLDNAVRHKIGLKRLQGTIRNKAVSKLNEYDEDVRRKLREHLPDILGPETVGTGSLPQLLEELSRINEKAWEDARGVLKSELNDATHYESDYQKKSLENIVPLDIEIEQPPYSQLDRMVEDEIIDIEDNSTRRDLDGWVDSARDDRQRKINNEIRMGAAEDLAPQTVEQQVMGTEQANHEDGSMHWGRIFAAGIAETALTHYTSQVQHRVANRNTNLIKGVQWVSTLDLRTTAICMSRDGNQYPTGQGPRPPAHYNCRSMITMITRSWQEMGIDAGEISPQTRASMDGQVPASMNYDEWLQRQPRYRVEQALGPERASLYLDGDLEVDKFTNRSGELIDLKTLEKRESRAFQRAADNRPDQSTIVTNREKRLNLFERKGRDVSKNLGSVSQARRIEQLEQEIQQEYNEPGAIFDSEGAMASPQNKEINDWLRNVRNRKLPTREARIRRLNSSWVRNNNRKIGIEMKEAVSREFDSVDNYFNPHNLSPKENLIEQTREDLRYLKQTTAQTLREKYPQGELTLYRGIGLENPSDFDRVNLASWTRNREIAEQYAQENAGSSKNPFVLEKTVKIEDILFSWENNKWVSGPYLSEEEYLALGRVPDDS